MKALKKVLLVLLAGSTLIIILLSLWVYQLNSTIVENLKTKKFLPPTEYYTAPKVYFAGMNVSLSNFKDELNRRGYRSKDSFEKIRPQEYWIGSAESCRPHLAEVEADETCVVFQSKESSDPQLVHLENQYFVFGANAQLKKVFHGKRPTLTQYGYLEPELIAQYLGKEPIQQKYTPLGQIPTSCLNGVLAIEDAHFLEHSGISYTGILRAAIKNLTGGRIAQGGSTITQQLVKNYFLNSDKTLKRKITEFFMSLILESHAGKDEILETYLNIVYLGQNGPFQIRGFPAGAQHFFDRQIQDLEPDQCALLAAVLNSPGLYDPFRHPENARKRRNLVLDKMGEHQFLSTPEVQTLQSKVLPTPRRHSVSETAPYFLDAVQKQLERIGVDYNGRKVFTTLDLTAQAHAQSAVQNKIQQLETENKKIIGIKQAGKPLEGLLISADNHTGEIRALVGGRSYRMTQYNRAIDSHRQVGSIMKPFVFLAALRSTNAGKMWTPTSIVQDSRFTIEYDKQKWSPENYGKKYYGPVPLYFALKNSLNCATASLGLEVGLDQVIKTAQLAGVSSRLEKVPSLTLGAFELYPLEVLQSYLVLANLGHYHEVTAVRYVLNHSERILYQHEVSEVQALEPEPTASLVSMMKQTILSGTAKSVIQQGFTYPAAGKTGTTSDSRDSWFAGFTPNLTTVSWVGYDDNTSHGLTGASGALPIWIEFMKKYAVIFPEQDFEWPASTKKYQVRNENDEEAKNLELIYSPGTQPEL